LNKRINELGQDRKQQQQVITQLYQNIDDINFENSNKNNKQSNIVERMMDLEFESKQLHKQLNNEKGKNQLC